MPYLNLPYIHLFTVMPQDFCGLVMSGAADQMQCSLITQVIFINFLLSPQVSFHGFTDQEGFLLFWGFGVGAVVVCLKLSYS